MSEINVDRVYRDITNQRYDLNAPEVVVPADEKAMYKALGVNPYKEVVFLLRGAEGLGAEVRVGGGAGTLYGTSETGEHSKAELAGGKWRPVTHLLRPFDNNGEKVRALVISRASLQSAAPDYIAGFNAIDIRTIDGGIASDAVVAKFSPGISRPATYSVRHLAESTGYPWGAHCTVALGPKPPEPKK